MLAPLAVNTPVEAVLVDDESAVDEIEVVDPVEDIHVPEVVPVFLLLVLLVGRLANIEDSAAVITSSIC